MGKLRGFSVAVGLGLLLSGCYPNVSEPWWNRQSAAPNRPADPPSAPQTDALKAGLYIVARGDTVFSIARRSGVAVRDLIDANRLGPPYRLLIGQSLEIPENNDYLVQKGDTVNAVARANGLNPREIIDTNGLSPPYGLIVGQRLKLPKAQPAKPPMSPQAMALAAPPPIAQPEPSAQPQPTEAAKPGPEPAALVIPEPRPQAGKGFLWPVEGRVVEGFGMQARGQSNDGINIEARRGAYVRSAENGVVVYAGGDLKGFGNLLLVKHQGGWVSAYAHNDMLLVGKGDKVSRGQPIARVGSTGHVVSPQLHFELRRNSKPVDPAAQLVRS